MVSMHLHYSPLYTWSNRVVHDLLDRSTLILFYWNVTNCYQSHSIVENLQSYGHIKLIQHSVRWYASTYLQSHYALITNDTNLKKAMFSLSERTAHRANHDALVGEITTIPVPQWGTQLCILSIEYYGDYRILSFLGREWICDQPRPLLPMLRGGL